MPERFLAMLIVAMLLLATVVSLGTMMPAHGAADAGDDSSAIAAPTEATSAFGLSQP